MPFGLNLAAPLTSLIDKLVPDPKARGAGRLEQLPPMEPTVDPDEPEAPAAPVEVLGADTKACIDAVRDGLRSLLRLLDGDKAGFELQPAAGRRPARGSRRAGQSIGM